MYRLSKSHRDYNYLSLAYFKESSRDIPSISVAQVYNTDTNYATNTTNTRFEDITLQNCRQRDKIRTVGLWWDVYRGQVELWWDVSNRAIFINHTDSNNKTITPAN